jgi:hypothetical protein
LVEAVEVETKEGKLRDTEFVFVHGHKRYLLELVEGVPSRC